MHYLIDACWNIDKLYNRRYPAMEWTTVETLLTAFNQRSK